MNLAKQLRNIAKDAQEAAFRKYRGGMYKKLKKKAAEGHREMVARFDSDLFTDKQLKRLQNGLTSQGFKISVSQNIYEYKLFIAW